MNHLDPVVNMGFVDMTIKLMTSTVLVISGGKVKNILLEERAH